MAFEPADRLKALPTYLFVEIDRKKRAAKEAGKDVIDFGIGDPDRPTHQFIIDRMNAAIADPANHRYPFDEGSMKYRCAMADFVEKRYGVKVDPKTELWATIGSKEGIAHLPLAVVNPGQKVLVPEPGYPVYKSATIMAGGEPYVMPLKEENDWLPDLDAIPAEVADQAAMMFINYPNNPTGAVATREFFEEVVAFGKKHNIIIVQDAAYNEMYFGNEKPLSILEIDGAKDVAIELHSASKTFNMTGWRIGFVIGNADVVRALGKVKSIIDSGVFGAVQDAAITAYEGIEHPDMVGMQETYRERAEVLVEGLRELGFRIAPPKATFYVWAGVPEGYDSFSLAGKLLDEAAVVCIPGAGFGPNGEGYVRFALSVETERIREALGRLKELKW